VELRARLDFGGVRDAVSFCSVMVLS
jgi:hypothetical protein